MTQKGEFVEDSAWPGYKEFAHDYSIQVPKPEKVICPGCSEIVVCDRLMGFGPRTGWCQKCKKAVEGTVML